jgi:hypothetical protein
MASNIPCFLRHVKAMRRNPSRHKTWTFTGKRALDRRGELARAQRLQGCNRCRPTSDGGLASAVGLHCAASATFVEQSFLDQPRVQKMQYANSESAEAARPRAYQRVVTFSISYRVATLRVLLRGCFATFCGPAQRRHSAMRRSSPSKKWMALHMR